MQLIVTLIEYLHESEVDRLRKRSWRVQRFETFEVTKIENVETMVAGLWHGSVSSGCIQVTKPARG